MAKTLAQLEHEMQARFRDLEIAEQRGLNQVALERLYQAYLKALAAWHAAKATQAA